VNLAADDGRARHRPPHPQRRGGPSGPLARRPEGRRRRADHRRRRLWSRYTAARALTPDVLEDPAGFAARVRELAEDHGPLVVYPGREEAIDALLASPPSAKLTLPYAGPAALRALRNKRELVSRTPFTTRSCSAGSSGWSGSVT